MNIEYLRSFRIFNMAIFDLVLAYLGVYLLSPLFIKLFKKLHINTTKAQWLWLTLPLSIPIHLLVSQETALTKMFLDPNGYYIVKIVVIGMVFMAFYKKK